MVGLALIVRILGGDLFQVAPNIPALLAVLIAAVAFGCAGGVAACVTWLLATLALLLPTGVFASPAGPGFSLSLGLSFAAVLFVTWIIGALAQAFDDLDARGAALRVSEGRLAAILDALPIGVAIGEAPTGRVPFVNSAVGRIFRGATPTTPDLAGYDAWESYDAQGRRTASRDYPLARVLATGEPAEGEYLFRRGDGSLAWLRIIGAPIRDPAGRLAAGVVGIVDVDKERRLSDHQSLLVAELSHRTKNILAVVQGLARATLSRAESLPAFRRDFEGRIHALSTAHSLLLLNDWTALRLRDLVEATLAPYPAPGRVRLDGPIVDIGARQGAALALILHELATNAAKHGALRGEQGNLALNWDLSPSQDSTPPRLRFHWHETGLPDSPDLRREGLGFKLVRRSVESELEGSFQHRAGSGDIEWRFEFDLMDRPALVPM